MDQLIEAIVKKLTEREKKVVTIHFQDENDYTSKRFIENKEMHIFGINSIVLKKMTSLLEDDFVSWIIEGISYGVIFHFHLSSSTYNLIPIEVLIKWPVKVYNEKNERVIAFTNKAITYKSMICLPDASVIVLAKGQIVTGLAKEVQEKKRIKVVERF